MVAMRLALLLTGGCRLRLVVRGRLLTRRSRGLRNTRWAMPMISMSFTLLICGGCWLRLVFRVCGWLLSRRCCGLWHARRTVPMVTMSLAFLVGRRRRFRFGLRRGSLSGRGRGLGNAWRAMPVIAVGLTFFVRRGGRGFTVPYGSQLESIRVLSRSGRDSQ